MEPSPGLEPAMTCTDFLAAINARLVDATEPVVMSDTLLFSRGPHDDTVADLIDVDGVANLRITFESCAAIVEPYTRPATQDDISHYLGTV